LNSPVKTLNLEPIVNYEHLNFENKLQVCNIEHKPFVVPKQDSSLSEKMTFLKLHPIQPSDIISLSFDPCKVYFRLLATGESLQSKW